MIPTDNAKWAGDARTSRPVAREKKSHASVNVPDGQTMSAPERRTTVPGVYKRGSSYVVRFKDKQGRSRKRSAPTLAAARRLKAQLVADVARGEYRDHTETFRTYATEWIDTYVGRTGRGVRAETVAEYRRTLEQSAIKFFGDTRLAEIEPRDIRRYAAAVAERKVKPKEGETRPVSRSTVRLALAPVRAMFAQAVEDGVLKVNPCAGIRLPSAPVVEHEDEDVKALTAAEARALVGQVPAEHVDLVVLMVETGLRISEALAIQWHDLDLGRRRLNVRRRLYKGKIGPLKSKYARREVPLTKATAQRLWQRQRDARGQPGEYVFTTATGVLLDRVNLGNRMLKPAAKRAVVEWATWHTLRHTCASILFREGWNAGQVCRLLGHHSPAFTLSVYIHVLDSDVPETDVLENVWVDTEMDTSPDETGRNMVDSIVPEAAVLQAISS